MVKYDRANSDGQGDPTTPTPVYFHDCPALGKHARVVKAISGSKDGSKLYGWQYRCPLCSYTVGDIQPMDTYEI